MKKCNCGNDMEDWMKKCKDCFGKDLDKARQARGEETPKDRHESIERQVAAKCAAQVLQGHDSTETTIKSQFDIFLKLIRGD